MNLPKAREAWPEAAREDFEERAAILTHEAGMPREDAESAAERLTRERWERLS